MTTGTLSFTIGNDFGILITTIAQEHLIYNLNPQKAIATIIDSLMGCSKELALKVLKGDIIIGVNADKQECFITKRQVKHEKIGYPKLNMNEWITSQANDIINNGKIIRNILDTLLFYGKYNKVKFEIEYSKLFIFFAGNDKEKCNNLLDEIEEVSRVEEIVILTKNYIEKSMKIIKVMDWMKVHYTEDFNSEDYNKINLCAEMLMAITNKFQMMANTDLSELLPEDESVDKYINSAIEINKTLSNKIEPVDIFKNYSAGWLSPDGKYYALNGQIENMLHNQIADALQEAGIIPNDIDEIEVKNNPDVWLEQQGWVKIHGNYINFAGCLNDIVGKENINMTNVQVKQICAYINHCHDGIIRLGWKQEHISAAKFEVLADNMKYMNEKYFIF